MYKYCPHCGKPFLEPDKPRTVGLVSQVKEFIHGRRQGVVRPARGV